VTKGRCEERYRPRNEKCDWALVGPEDIDRVGLAYGSLLKGGYLGRRESGAAGARGGLGGEGRGEAIGVGGEGREGTEVYDGKSHR